MEGNAVIAPSFFNKRVRYAETYFLGQARNIYLDSALLTF